MVADSYDVVVVGAGADGPVAAWRLAEAGLSVLVLEAGPFHGNEKWPKPHEEPGAEASSSVDDLSGELLDEQFTGREMEMFQKLTFGPADHERGLWFRKFPSDGVLLQCAGVGGTTLHYGGCHPRAFPASIDEQGHWPIDYADLIPYYQELEELCHVQPAPVTAKEELFFRGAAAAGWNLIEDRNVTEAGYRPEPNAFKQPDERLHVDGDYDGDFTYPDIDGSTLAISNTPGNPQPRGAPFDEKARRSSNISFVPLGLETENMTIQPNAFVTDVLTETAGTDHPTATGVEFRDTWSGDTDVVNAEVVILAAGAIETPRLWLNADLPRTEWVGRGLTIHPSDTVIGVWDDEDTLSGMLGKESVDQHQGQEVAARLDVPGLGTMYTIGVSPGISAFADFGASSSGFTFQNDTEDAPWDSLGRLAGKQLKKVLSGYRRMLQIYILTDDRPLKRNGVTTTQPVADEHGPVPLVNYVASDATLKRRKRLAEIAAEILREAGASHIHRSDSAPKAAHIHSTMRMGKVVDKSCESYEVDRLFIADHSVLANGIGGTNPTNTGQALAARTADKILDRYF